jgi:glycosyltransferase involved in cell wall biosynthesis
MESRLRRTGLELGRDVIAAGRVPEERLWALMRGCDVCVSLRWPTMGETSGAVLRTLSAGVPLVVSDIGWFAELPGDVAAKVPVDEHEVETLAAFLRRIADDDELRTGMGAAALRYAREEHDLGRVADLYAAALEEAAGGPQVTEAVLRELAGAAADVQLEADADELGEIAGRFRETRLGR